MPKTEILEPLLYLKDNLLALIIVFIIFSVLITAFIVVVNKLMIRDSDDRKSDLEQKKELNQEIRDQLIEFKEGFMYFISNKNQFQFLIDNFSVFTKFIEYMTSGGTSMVDEFENSLEDLNVRLKRNYGNGSNRLKGIQTITYSQNHLIEYINDSTLSDSLKLSFLVLTDFLVEKLLKLLGELEKIEVRVQKPLLVDGNIRLLKMIVNYFNIIIPNLIGSDDWEKLLKEKLENKYHRYFMSDIEIEECIDIKKEFGVNL